MPSLPVRAQQQLLWHPSPRRALGTPSAALAELQSPWEGLTLPSAVVSVTFLLWQLAMGCKYFFEDKRTMAECCVGSWSLWPLQTQGNLWRPGELGMCCGFLKNAEKIKKFLPQHLSPFPCSETQDGCELDQLELGWSSRAWVNVSWHDSRLWQGASVSRLGLKL